MPCQGCQHHAKQHDTATSDCHFLRLLWWQMIYLFTVTLHSTTVGNLLVMKSVHGRVVDISITVWFSAWHSVLYSDAQTILIVTPIVTLTWGVILQANKLLNVFCMALCWFWEFHYKGSLNFAHARTNYLIPERAIGYLLDIMNFPTFMIDAQQLRV